MTSSLNREHSLFRALSRGRETPVRPESYAFILRRFLAPDEHVHLALEGNALTWVDDPILLITDRRLLRLQQDLFFTPARKRFEAPIRDVVGASINSRLLLFGSISIHLRENRRHRMMLTTEAPGRAFVESLNQLVADATGR